MSVHSGHRQRLRSRFLREGLDNFEEVNALELLLFYCIPRKDTNELAHALLSHFGSFHQVMDATPEELMAVPGIGEGTATFLPLISAACRYYRVNQANDGLALDSIEKCGDFLVNYFHSRKNETVILLCLDAKCKVLCCKKIGEGSINSASVPIRRVVEIALGNNAVSVVLAHNHPGGLAIPSPGDYMIYPASMAVAIGEHLGMPKEEIVAGVAAYVSTGSRMRRIRLAQDRLVIDDCYNANPQAMSEALRILAKSIHKKLAILGDMGELGDLTPAAHRAAGELAAELGLDAVVAIGPKSADIAAGGGSVVRHFLTIEEAMPMIHRLFTPGTTVLVKASHAMEFGKIVKELEETYQ